jgi:hypothetical protein
MITLWFETFFGVMLGDMILMWLCIAVLSVSVVTLIKILD